MKIKSICLFSMLLFSCSWCYGQSWHWVKGSKNHNDSSWIKPLDLITDDSGNVFQTGIFSGDVKFGTVTLNNSAHGWAPFLVKFNNTGSILWGIAFNNFGINFGVANSLSVATDKVGNVSITGYYSGNLSVGSFTFPYAVNRNLFVAKFTSSGIFLWASYSQSSTHGSAKSFSVIMDNFGNTYITGYCTDTLTLGSFHHYANKGSGFFLAKYDNLGNIIWVKTNSNTQYSFGNNIITDTVGNIYVYGQFQDTLTIDSVTITSNTSMDVFWAKFTPSGHISWLFSAIVNSSQAVIENYNTYLCGRYLAMDKFSNLYFTGIYGDSARFGPYILNDSNSSDEGIFLVKCSSSGNVLWAKQNRPMYFQSSSVSPLPNSLSCTKQGILYLSGQYSDSIAFNPLELKNDTEYNSAFLYMFDSLGAPLCCTSVSITNPFNQNSVSANPIGNTVFFSGSVNAGNYKGTQGCYFGNYYLEDTNQFAFLTNWSCCCSSLNPSITHKNVTCRGDTNGAASFFVTGGTYPYSYSWKPIGGNDSVTRNLLSGIYTVTCIDYNGCTTSDTVFIRHPSPPAGNACCDSTITDGQDVQLISSGGTSYSWSPDTRLSCDTCPNPIATPSKTTTYIVKVVNDSGCSVTDSITVVVVCRPVSVCCDSLITNGGAMQLYASGGTSYLWTPAIKLNCDTCSSPIATPIQNTTYTVIINDSGCISTRTVTIDVRCGEIFVPDIFSPNQNVNNILYVRGPCISTLDFMVFDRWGNKVYETQNKNDGWDGTYKGQAMNTATYMYYAKATMYDGSVVEKKGSVTLVR